MIFCGIGSILPVCKEEGKNRLIVPKNVIQEIKDRLDIVAIIGEYVHSLKNVGKNWSGLCPFHNDRNPSFNVSPDLGIFKCFSCGEGGDIVSFIQKIENISFTEAIKILAKRAGIELNLSSEEQSESFHKKEELLQFNNRLIKLFQYFLLERVEGKKAIKYLDQRGIDQTLIDVFKIGYTPRDYNRLSNFFLNKGFKEDFLISTGLFSNGDRGLKPLFFDRIIFPIINQNEECIGFGGRAISDDVKPKYINTPETLLYKKRYNLYGINISKKFIREEKKVFLVEGYMDVISCYKNGVKNSIAPCGTAITREQISLLNRYSEEVVLLLDADEAGKKGVEKALKESANILIKTSVLILPDQMDPDDYFKKFSIFDFKEFEKQSIDGFDFLLQYRTRDIDKNNYKKLIDALNLLFGYINLWESEVVKNSLIERMAEIFDIDKAMVAREFLTYKKKKRYSRNIDDVEELRDNNVVLDDLKKREIDLILFLLHITETEKIIKQCGLREEHFYHLFTQKLFKLFFNEISSINRKDFLNYIDDNDIKNYIEERLFSDEFKQPEEILRNNVIDRIIDVIKRYYLRLNQNINEKLRLGELYKDDDLVKKLQEEKSVIINEIVKLSKLQELKN